MPIGGSSIARLVPLALGWENPKPIISAGITRMPPPIPTIPLIMPIASPTRTTITTTIGDIGAL